MIEQDEDPIAWQIFKGNGGSRAYTRPVRVHARTYSSAIMLVDVLVRRLDAMDVLVEYSYTCQHDEPLSRLSFFCTRCFLAPSLYLRDFLLSSFPLRSLSSPLRSLQ